MRWSVFHAGVFVFSLCSVGLLAQHAGTSAPVHAGPSLAAPPHRFPVPANLASPDRVDRIGRTGHWPSWKADSLPARSKPIYPYVYPGLLSFGYGLPAGYGLTGEVDQPEATGPAQPPPLVDPQLAENAPPYRPPYRGDGAAPSIDAPVHPQPATTLVFKDGRPQKQVHNYALTGSTLWALDGDTRQEIPLDALDVPATVKANRDAGVDFALPTSR